MSLEHDQNRDLHTCLVGAVRRACAIPERAAVPIADIILAALREHYGGEQLYIQKPRREVERREVLAALDRNESRDTICRRLGISRAKFYRLVAGGDEEIA